MKDDETALELLARTNLTIADSRTLQSLYQKLWNEERNRDDPNVVAACSLLITELNGRQTQKLFWISTGFAAVALVIAFISFMWSLRDANDDRDWRAAQITLLGAIDDTIVDQVEALYAEVDGLEEATASESARELRSLLKLLGFSTSCHDDHEVWSHDRVFVHFAAESPTPEPNHFFVGPHRDLLSPALSAYACRQR